MKTKRILAACAILAASSAAGVAGWRYHVAKPLPARGGDAPAPGRVEASIVEDVWKLGEERRYRILATTQVEGEGDQDSASTAIKTELDLRLVAASKEQGRTVVRGLLHASKLQIGKDGDSEDRTEELNRSLSKPFAVAFDNRGTITEFLRDKAIEPLADGILRAVVSSLQFVRPESETAQTWSTEETDSTGRHTAKYRRVSGPAFEKTAERYTDLSKADPGRLNRTRSVTTRIERKPNGVLALADRKETQAALVTGVRLSSHSVLSLQLTAIGTSAVAPGDLQGLQAVPLDGPPAGNASQHDRLQLLAKGHSVTELAGTIAAHKGKSFENQKEVLEQLVAVLSVGGPGALRDASREIRVAASPESARAVLGALVSTEGAGAQSTLAELARDPSVSEDLRAQALMGLGTADSPTRDSIEQLQALAKDEDLSRGLRDTALLALGAAVGENDGADPSAAKAAETSSAFLVQGLENARNPTEAAAYADALGNAARPDGLGALLNLAKSPDPRLRGTAISALRKMQGPEVEALLASTLRSDPDPSVRSDALQALRYRELTSVTLAALVHVIKQDQVKSVRHQAVGVAVMHAEDVPELMAAVAWASEHDPDKDVRELASRSLNADPVNGPPPPAK